MRFLRFLAELLLHAFAPVIPMVAGALLMWVGEATGIEQLGYVGMVLVGLGVVWFGLRMIGSLDL